jgi:hypothetical protein
MRSARVVSSVINRTFDWRRGEVDLEPVSQSHAASPATKTAAANPRIKRPVMADARGFSADEGIRFGRLPRLTQSLDHDPPSMATRNEKERRPSRAAALIPST